MFRLGLVVALGVLCLTLVPCRAQDKPTFAGPNEKGFLLPNGWTISPAGKQITLTDLPLNILPLADGRHVLVGTSGYNKHELSLIDLQELKVVDSKPVSQSWFGMRIEPSMSKVWWSGGGSGNLHTFDWKDNRLTRVGPAEPAPKKAVAGEEPHFKSGLALDLHKQRFIRSM